MKTWKIFHLEQIPLKMYQGKYVFGQITEFLPCRYSTVLPGNTMATRVLELLPVGIRCFAWFSVSSLTGKVNRIWLLHSMLTKPNRIAIIYKNRWQEDLFFKWIKQHLKVKNFWGYTPKAVKTQLYCTIITYCMVVLVGKELKMTSQPTKYYKFQSSLNSKKRL